jgi:hypothetical protein
MFYRLHGAEYLALTQARRSAMLEWSFQPNVRRNRKEILLKESAYSYPRFYFCRLKRHAHKPMLKPLFKHVLTARSAARGEIIVLIEHQPVDKADSVELHSWTRAWYDAAVRAGFIQPPYRPDDVTVTCLQQYFKFGLGPAEAVEAFFSLKH